MVLVSLDFGEDNARYVLGQKIRQGDGAPNHSSLFALNASAEEVAGCAKLLKGFHGKTLSCERSGKIC